MVNQRDLIQLVKEDLVLVFDSYILGQRMSYTCLQGFGKECMPRGQCTFGARLEDEDIQILAEFVKLQADQGWPSIETKEE